MISAKVICDSLSPSGTRLTTFVVEYPRLIHSELMTHRMLSRNAASSRAIPFAKMQEQLTGKPVRFGAANKGMQDTGISLDAKIVYSLDPYTQTIKDAEDAWIDAKNSALHLSKAFHDAGYHKQVYNRLTEPFQTIKAIISATEWDNFFWLRDDDAADPTIAALAREMKKAYDASVPQQLKAGEWHLPYVYYERYVNGVLVPYEGDSIRSCSITLEEAIKVSCARCAAVSYRNIDYGLEKCLEVYDRLIGSEKKHSSALEHAAQVMNKSLGSAYTSWCINHPEDPSSWQEGISHADREGNLWSGNFKDFIQHRKTIVGENYVKA